MATNESWILISTALVLAFISAPGLRGQEAEPEPAPAPEAATEAEAREETPEEAEDAIEVFEGAYLARLLELQPQAQQEAVSMQATANAQAEETVNKATVATPTDQAASTTKDLLSRLLGAFGLGDLSDDGQSFVLGGSPASLDLGSGGQVGFQIKVRQAEPFETLINAVSEDAREALRQKLSRELGDLDDVELTVTWGREDSRFGRDPADYQDLTSELFGSLVEVAFASADATMQKLLQSGEGVSIDGVSVESEMSLEDARESGIAFAEAQVDLKSLADGSGFFTFGDLVNNQPQLHASAKAWSRDERAGRDEIGASFTWEKGFVNVNTLIKDCVPDRPSKNWKERVQALGKDFRAQGDPAESCYARYVTRNGNLIQRSPRMKLEIEYAATESYENSLAEEDVSLALPSANRLSGVFSFRSYLSNMPETGGGWPELSFEARYEKVSDEEVRNDKRFVATLTYSQKLSDASTASLSLVYANKPEFLGEVDEELGARLGLKFRVPESKMQGDG